MDEQTKITLRIPTDIFRRLMSLKMRTGHTYTYLVVKALENYLTARKA